MFQNNEYPFSVGTWTEIWITERVNLMTIQRKKLET